MVSEAQARTIAFLGALIILVLGVCGGYALGGYPLAAVTTVAIFVAILLMRHFLRPPWWGRKRVQLATLAIFSLATVSMVGPDPLILLILELISPIFEQINWISISSPLTIPFAHKLVLLGIVGFFLLGFHFLWERRQILLPPNVLVEKDKAPFPEEGYEKLRDRFCNFMVSELDRYDRDVNWSDSELTPLEAEVEMERRGALRPRVVKDLVAAIRRDHRTRSFLVIGDPGSGKSVSLRRLCRELYRVVPQTGIVPVYVNLREWQGLSEPTDTDIADYIFRYLKRLTGREGKTFLETWYKPMLRHGRFFFLLDSFDEMPPVLDCDDRSPRLKRISEAFDRFFHDMHMCRGVLASRPFRQPIGFRGRRLAIRPFSETQVRKAMKTWLLGKGLNADAIVWQLFKERPELAPAVRNPFTADLISQYVSQHDGALPLNYYAIFDNYVTMRLAEDAGELKEMGFTPKQILDCATEVAWKMYNTPDIGIEAEVRQLQRWIADSTLLEKIRAMRDSRLVRLGGVNSQRLAFVHRRFAEFFAVRALIKRDEPIDLKAIPSDSRWRDCLVVYCGIAPVSEAQKIADYCWEIIQEGKQHLEEGDIDHAKPAIHCLRFLRDAFQSRPECIHRFSYELSDTILYIIKHDEILPAKIAAESLSLVRPFVRSRGVKEAFERGIPWISQTAIRTCRHLAVLEKDALRSIRKYVRKMPTVEFLRSFRDLHFSFGLSDSLKRQKRAIWADLGMLVVAILSFLALAISGLSILYAFAALLIGIFLQWVLPGLSRLSYEHRYRSSLRTGVFLVVMWLLFFADTTAEMSDESQAVLSFDEILLQEYAIDSSWMAWKLRFVLIGIPFTLFFSWLIWLYFDREILPPDKKPRPLKTTKNVSRPLKKPDKPSRPLKEHLEDILEEIRRVFDECPQIFLFPFILLLVVVLVWAWSNVVPETFTDRVEDIFVNEIEPLREKIEVLVIGLLLFIVPIAFFATFVIFGFFIVMDRRRLSNAGLPDSITRTWIYETCSTFQTSWGRQRFLEQLIANRVQASGEKLPLPDEKWVDKIAKEQLARLEEQWYGLEE